MVASVDYGGYCFSISHSWPFGIYPTQEITKSIRLDLWFADWGVFMNAKEAVAKRIVELCIQHDIAINALANISGIPPSTIYSILNKKSKNPGVISIQKICDGLEISVREFFDSPLFDNLEPEIR